MKIYISHASQYDYRIELYQPLKAAFAAEYDIFFPHETYEDGVEAKAVIKASDLVLAEVSYPSTGQGIELGWADANGVPIICFHTLNAKATAALQFINTQVLEYQDVGDMIVKLRGELERIAA